MFFLHRTSCSLRKWAKQTSVILFSRNMEREKESQFTLFVCVSRPFFWMEILPVSKAFWNLPYCQSWSFHFIPTKLEDLSDDDLQFSQTQPPCSLLHLCQWRSQQPDFGCFLYWVSSPFYVVYLSMYYIKGFISIRYVWGSLDT